MNAGYFILCTVDTSKVWQQTHMKQVHYWAISKVFGYHKHMCSCWNIYIISIVVMCCRLKWDSTHRLSPKLGRQHYIVTKKIIGIHFFPYFKLTFLVSMSFFTITLYKTQSFNILHLVGILMYVNFTWVNPITHEYSYSLTPCLVQAINFVYLAMYPN